MRHVTMKRLETHQWQVSCQMLELACQGQPLMADRCNYLQFLYKLYIFMRAHTSTTFTTSSGKQKLQTSLVLGFKCLDVPTPTGTTHPASAK